jgi:16S rRNA (uracil1498-N3)-methyltransferase
MHRFHLPPEQCAGPELLLTGTEAHHALHVLRLRAGDPVTVLDGAGAELACEVSTGGRDQVPLKVVRRTSIPALPHRVTLLQALPKGKLIESIVQKATELGIHRVVPLFTERTVSRPAEENPAAKVRKWRQIAIESVKQCGSPWLPEVEPPLLISEFLARKETFDLSLIASLQPDARHARERFAAYVREHRHPPHSVAVWVGPEGDFAPEEVAAIQAGGALPITLGRLVLRSETAAIYCLSILQHELSSAP